MTSKKASSFYLLIVTLVVVSIMFFTIFKIIDKYKEISNNKEIGQRQSELFQIYQKGEKALLYVDQSAKLSAVQPPEMPNYSSMTTQTAVR